MQFLFGYNIRLSNGRKTDFRFSVLYLKNLSFNVKNFRSSPNSITLFLDLAFATIRHKNIPHFGLSDQIHIFN